MNLPAFSPRSLTSLSFVTLLFFSHAACSADQIRAAMSVSGPTPIEDYLWERTLDQSGLSAGYVNGVSDFDLYVGGLPFHSRISDPPNFAASFEFGDITYDLGAEYAVNQLALWNYPFSNSGGIRVFEVTTSLSSDFSNNNFAGSFSAVDDGDGQTNLVQVFDLVDTWARYVRIGRVTGGSNGLGLSEVAFGVNGAPEPTSLGLMAAGLVATVLRRKE